MLPQVQKRAMPRLVSDAFKKIVVNHLSFQNHTTGLLQTQLTRPMQTIESCHMLSPWVQCKGSKSPSLSLFHTVMELNHYNKYPNSRICLKPVTAYFSFHLQSVNKRSDWWIQCISIYRFYLSAEFFEVRTGLALNHTGLAAPTAVSACCYVGCGHGSAGHFTAHFWCSACPFLPSRYQSIDVTMAHNNGRTSLKNYRGESLLYYSFHYTSQEWKLQKKTKH